LENLRYSYARITVQYAEGLRV